MSASVGAHSESPVKQGVAAGTSFLAATLLLCAGMVSIFQGIAALADNDVFVVGVEYTYEFDVVAWGWIHIVVGAVGVVIALGLFAGATWARGMAFVVAALSIVANFLWMPYFPTWSMVIIALDIVVIWAVATWRPAP
ncbi:DUF7144 family membrane protein [Rhodococcus globerulus]|uniref:DUF7144 family membrane protein n=1 Tax=Rhodococcus globerulus TaxID=33008 RepID=UPI0030182188